VCVVALAAGAANADAPDPLAHVQTNAPAAIARMMETIVPLAPHVWALHAPLSSGPVPLANELVVEQADGLVLIDAGKTRGAGKRIVALIRRISPKPVKAVLITHWHQDHVLGLGPIVEAWPTAAIIASAGTRDAIETDESYKPTPRDPHATAQRDHDRPEQLRKSVGSLAHYLTDPDTTPLERRNWAEVTGVLDQRIADEQGTYLVVPTVTFAGHYRIGDAQAPVEVSFVARGHSVSESVVWLPRQRIVAPGDLVVRAPVPYLGSDLLAWPDALRRIEALRPRIVVPGHGQIMRDTSYLDEMRTVMAEMADDARTLQADKPGLTEDQATEAAPRSRHEALYARDPWTRFWFRDWFSGGVAKIYAQIGASGAARP